MEMSVPIWTNVGIGRPVLGRDCEKLTDLLLASNAFPENPNPNWRCVQCIRQKSTGELSSTSVQCSLPLTAEVGTELETGWNLETKSQQCNSELRIARPTVLTGSPPCPPLFFVLEVTESQWWVINSTGFGRKQGHHNTRSEK